ncbi:MAG TPA: MobF family relaxase [Candidatus Paceibacterota bacterium]|nr:MobF family relaxase [Candidatus Paceibacterota bacterium]
MLTAKAQYSLNNAEKYFKEHLSAGDYYAEGKHVPGEWFGDGAKRLGLSGKVGMDDFVKLCRNIAPGTDERLTQRMKLKNRRVFYDFTLSPPKSVSIVALVGGDRRIEDAHQRAVKIAVAELEKFAAARVRKNGGSSYRNSGNVVGALFHHDTSRALDPHLHCHCIVFNATHDRAEDRWKALETYEMLAACKFVENVYYHELAKDLRRCGYELENSRRGDFEVEGISQSLIERFSKRHAEIDRETQALLEGAPQKRNGNLKDIRENIAHNKRARKIRDIGRAKLNAQWAAQVSSDEKVAIANATQQNDRQRKTFKARDAVNAAITWAEEHLFDRRSVVNEFELWRHTLEHGRGQRFSLRDVQALTRARPYVRNESEHSQKVTTRKTLEREKAIIRLAQDGRGRFAPLNAGHKIQKGPLDDEQCAAVQRILRSRDYVTLFRGAAGTGKSFTLREVRAGLVAAARPVHVIAPQRQQAMDLQRDFGSETQTVSEFLTKQRMAAGAVVIVDEAGQIGAKQMLQLLRFVRTQKGRLILSGDTRQHGPVEASDALRAIEKYAGLGAAEITTIRRQNPNLARTREERKAIEEYRSAVDEARNGRFRESFDRLNRNRTITQCGLFEQQDLLAHRYLEFAAQRLSVVIVSQTWSEIHKVNERIRDALRQQGVVGAKDVKVRTLERLDLTDAQKRDRRFYSGESVLVLNRDVAGMKRGTQCRLLEIGENCMIVEGAGKIRRIQFGSLDCVTVCEPKELALAAGDRLQLKANARTNDGRQLANGEIVTVGSIEADGQIRLHDGRMLDASYRQFVRGYAVTSYAAQGKTADFVIFSDSAIRAATNQKQWYVTISRGRRGIEIFTTDKQELRENVIRSGNRELAIELTENATRSDRRMRSHTHHSAIRESRGERPW